MHAPVLRVFFYERLVPVILDYAMRDRNYRFSKKKDAVKSEDGETTSDFRSHCYERLRKVVYEQGADDLKTSIENQKFGVSLSVVQQHFMDALNIILLLAWPKFRAEGKSLTPQQADIIFDRLMRSSDRDIMKISNFLFHEPRYENYPGLDTL